jgi:beta-lactamase regulating signal transducer with metallopeptidase domain
MLRISELLLNFGLNAAWQMLVIFSVASVGSYFLRNGPARYRYGLWLATLVLSVLGPLWSVGAFSPAPVQSSNVEIKSSAPNSVSPEKVVATTTAPEPIAGFNQLVTPRRQVVNTPRHGLLILGSLYVLVILFRIIRLAGQWLAQNRLRQSATRPVLPLVESIARRCETAMGLKGVSVGYSSMVSVPAALGARKPIIVLPERLCLEADEEILVSVIGHEMAHVSRRDFAINFIGELVSLPISFHPLTYLIKSEIQRNRELACDELVTQRLLAPQAYARSLVRVANATMRPADAFTLGLFGGDVLEERITRLTKKRAQLGLRVARPVMALALCVLGAVVFSISAFSFDLRSPKSTNHSNSATRTGSSQFDPAAVLTSKDQDPDAGRSRKPLLDSPSAQERAQAACDAGRSQAIDAIPSLISMLGDDTRTEPIRCWEFGSWSPALHTFKHPSPGEQAAIALASMGSPAFAPLVNQLTSKNSTVRRNAAWAIGELHEMPPATRAAAGPDLASLLGDADEWVRMAAARALGELRDSRATEALVLRLSDSNWRVRELATWALSEMKDPRAVEGLCKALLSDAQVQVRFGAADALGEIRNAEAIPALKQALNDPESNVRGRVAWAISEIEDD